MALRSENQTAESPPHLLARILTEVLAPSPVALLTLSLFAWRFSPTTGEAIKWALLTVGFVVALPLLYLVTQVRRGHVTDIHVRQREQRLPIILLFLASWFVGVALLWRLGAPHELIALILTGAITLIASAIITLRWKISIHVAVAAGVLAVLAVVFGPPVLLALPLIPLLAWARIEVRDHTIAQVVAGAALGASVSYVAFVALSRTIM